MNIKKIIREEADDFQWIRDIEPSESYGLSIDTMPDYFKDKMTEFINKRSWWDKFGSAEITVKTPYGRESGMTPVGRVEIEKSGRYGYTESYVLYLNESGNFASTEFWVYEYHEDHEDIDEDLMGKNGFDNIGEAMKYIITKLRGDKPPTSGYYEERD